MGVKRPYPTVVSTLRTLRTPFAAKALAGDVRNVALIFSCCCGFSQEHDSTLRRGKRVPRIDNCLTCSAVVRMVPGKLCFGQGIA